MREGNICLWRPGKWECGRGEASERGCNPAVVADEPPVKVGKTEKLLFLTGTGGGPVCNRPDLLWAGPHLPALNDVAEEGNRGCTKLAFLSLYIEFIFQQSLENLPDMLDVFLLVAGKN